jgi:hypothetical protein
MKFAMEFFIPHQLASNSILAQYITRSNNFVITKHQVPFGMSKQTKFDIYEMVNLKNKIGLFYVYLYSLILAMFNLFTYLNKPTYLIGFNNYLPT